MSFKYVYINMCAVNWLVCVCVCVTWTDSQAAALTDSSSCV